MRARLTIVILLATAAFACQTGPSEDSKEKLLDIYMGNAQNFYDGRHFRSAIQQAEKVLSLEADHGKARFVRAMSMLKLPDPQGVQFAESELELLKEEDFEKRQFRVWIGVTMARGKVGDLYDARYRNLVAQIEADPFAAKELIPRRDEADRQRKKRWRSSIEAAQAVLSYTDQPLARNDPTALYYLYRNHSLLGDHRQALTYEERHLGVIVGSRTQWEKSIEKYPNAKKIYESKLEGARKHEAALREMMANTLFELGRNEESLAQLDEVIGLVPERADVYLNRAQIHRSLGHHAQAVVDLKKFIQRTTLGPDDERAQEAVALLRDSQEKMLEKD